MLNAQSSKRYKKSCFERNHSKMKAFEIVKISNRQQDKENISSVDRELNENGFYLNKTTKEADFYGLFAFKMNDSHSNLVNSVLYSSNGSIRYMEISVFLYLKRSQCQETQKRKRKIISHSTFNFVDPRDFDKKQKGIIWNIYSFIVEQRIDV